MTEPVIRIEHLYKEYATDAGPVPVLKDVDLTVMPGEFVAIMGPSGSGKSTFMNILGCLDVPSSGRYSLNGADVGAMNQDQLAQLRNQVIGFVFQGFNLFPALNAVEQVELPLSYLGLGAEETRRRAWAALDEVGLAHRRHMRPAELSGGEKQRVAIARALAKRPQLLFADEPTSALDSVSGQTVIDILHRAARMHGTMVLCASHDPRLIAHADRVLRMEDGRVLADEHHPHPPMGVHTTP